MGTLAAVVLFMGLVGFLAYMIGPLRFHWAEEAQKLGLRRVGEGRYGGEIQGFEVTYGPPRGSLTTGVEGWHVPVPTGLLSLRPRSSADGNVMSTGDPSFDQHYVARGSPSDLSWLGSSVREALVRLDRAKLEQGELSYGAPHFDLSDLWPVLAVVRALRALPAEPAERLRRLAADPWLGVRQHSLRWASELDLDLAIELAKRLRQDEGTTTRAMAAALLEDGLLPMATDDPELELRLWAARTLLRAGTPEQRGRAGELLLRDSMASLQTAGVSLLRSLGPEAEPILLESLSRIDGPLLEQIAGVLQEVGTVSAVSGLRARQERLSVLQVGLRQALERAVLAIQERAGGTQGALALAPEQGALSVAREKGALALREPT